MTDTSRTPPHDLEAEQAAVGAAMLSRDAREYCALHLDTSDFYRPANAHIWGAIASLHAEGAAVDHVTVVAALRKAGVLDKIGGEAVLVSIKANTPAASSAKRYVEIVREHAAARRLIALATEAIDAAYDHKDPYVAADELTAGCGVLDRASSLPDRFWADIDAYLDEEHREVGVPLIPGLLYRRTRVMVIAKAKAGKSTVLRVLGYCASQGIHPFRLTPIDPVRVLFLDCENDDDELVPAGRDMRTRIQRTLGIAWDPTRLALFSMPYGMDLSSRRDRGELEEVLERSRPQLIVGGPIYKMLPDDKRGDRDLQAGQIQGYLDGLRRRYGCAMVLEHHTPTSDDSRAKGGQRWEAWPELTIRLTAKDGRLSVGYPHPPRGQFQWPKAFSPGRSHEMPWMASYETRADDPAPRDEDAPPDDICEPF